MTKKEIVKQISERVNLTQLKTKEIVDGTFQAIIDTLATEGRIELRKFGVFEVRLRKARKARNPRTGDTVLVKSKNVVTFQPGKEMELRARNAKTVILKRKPRKAKRSSRTNTVPVLVPNGVPSEPSLGSETQNHTVLNDGVPLKSR